MVTPYTDDGAFWVMVVVCGCGGHEGATPAVHTTPHCTAPLYCCYHHYHATTGSAWVIVWVCCGGRVGWDLASGLLGIGEWRVG